jgi:hypothetical protein
MKESRDRNKSWVIKISSDNYDTIQMLRQSGETPNGVVTRLLDEYMQIEISSKLSED